MIVLYILLRWQTYFNSRVISAVAFLFSIIFGITGMIVFVQGVILFMKDNDDVIKENEDMSNFYIKTNRFFKAGGVLIDKTTDEEFKMIVPLHSFRPRFPDNVADRKIRLFPICSQEYEFPFRYKPSLNIEVYLKKDEKKIDLCNRSLENEFGKRFTTGIFLVFFGMILVLVTIVLCMKSMTNSCIDTNTNLGSAITSIIGIIILPVGAIIISNSLNYFLDVNLTKEEKNKAGLPDPHFNTRMTTGIVLLILHFAGNIFIMTVGAILRSKELELIRKKAIEMDIMERKKNVQE